MTDNDMINVYRLYDYYIEHVYNNIKLCNENIIEIHKQIQYLEAGISINYTKLCNNKDLVLAIYGINIESTKVLPNSVKYMVIVSRILSELKQNNFSATSSDVSIVINIARNYYDDSNKIKTLKQEVTNIQNDLLLYESFLNLPKNVFIHIIKRANKYYERFIVDGGRLDFGFSAGTIKIYYKKVTGTKFNSGKRVNFNRSNALKQQLIEKGEIPYNKEDHLKAIAEGKEYKGKKWFIYNTSSHFPFVRWTAPNEFKNNNLKFIPARHNHSNMTYDQIENTINSVDELCELDLGLQHKSYLATKVDELHFTKYKSI